MALDDLQAVIEKLRITAQSQQDYISGYETRTRQVLIDPLLEALGWVVSDPDLVELEYSAGGGRADYALKSNGKVVAVIEAKSLGKPLEQKELDQVLQYAVGRGIPYMGVTNGDEWRMYDVFKAKPIEEKVIMEFTLSRTPPHKSALRSLSMWHANLGSGAAPTTASEPVLVVKKDQNEVGNPTNDGPVQPDNVDWISIATLTEASAKEKPVRVKTGTGAGVSLPRSGWKNATIELTRSLIENGLLTPEMCPVFVIGSKQPVVTMGKQHARSVEIAGNLWVNTNKTSQDLIQLIRSVLKACELSEESVYVSYSPK